MVPLLTILLLGTSGPSSSFQLPQHAPISNERRLPCTRLRSTQLERDEDVKTVGSDAVRNNKKTTTKLISSHSLDIPTNLISDEDMLLDLSSYENSLLSSWDESSQGGFDWEIEKLRRHFAGLRQREDGTWVQKDSLFDFLITHTPSNVAGAEYGYVAPPKPVNMLDVGVLITKNLLAAIGFGPSLGMAAVPDAIIQKYEGSFFSFIKGALGGDLQTLAGGPLFLLLAKYYHVHGPIFNLSFGPKSFLIISDPVMARHILKSSPEQYCKGILADVLEPIMGDGLIPADPKIWKVREEALSSLNTHEH